MITEFSVNNMIQESATKVSIKLRHVRLGELADILSFSKQAVSKRSIKESWLYEEVPVNGGLQKLFPIETLPPHIQRTVRIHFGELPEELAECVPAGFDKDRVERCARSLGAAADWQREGANDRLTILRALTTFRNTFRGGRQEAIKRFVKRYRDRHVEGLDPEIYGRITKTGRSALHEWERRFAEDGLAGLLPPRANNKGRCSIPLDRQKFILGIIK